MALKHGMVLAIVTLVMTFLYGEIDYTVEPYTGWDLASYRVMAAASPGIAKDVGKPFAYRLLGPYIAGLLPLRAPVAFRALAIFASLSLVLLFYFFLRYTGISAGLSLITSVLVTFNKWWFGFTVWDYFQVNDVLALCFIVVMVWCMFPGRWFLFGAALVLGAATKESCMLMVPVVFVYLLEKRAPSTTWGKALVSVLPGVLIFFGIRALVPAAKGLGPVDAFLSYSIKFGYPDRLFRLLVNSFVPWSLVPFVFIGMTVRFFGSNKYSVLFMVLVFLSALFAANDERLMAPALVFSYLLVGKILQEIKPDTPLLAALIACGFASSLHHIFARYPLPNRLFTEVLSLGALIAVTLVALIARRARSRG